MKREIQLWDRDGLAAIRFIYQLERDMTRISCEQDLKHKEAATMVQIIKDWLAERKCSIRLFIDNNCTGIMTYNQMFIGNISRFTEMNWCPVNFTDCTGFAEFLEIPFETASDTQLVCTLKMQHFLLTIDIQNSHNTHQPEFQERNGEGNPSVPSANNPK